MPPCCSRRYRAARAVETAGKLGFVRFVFRVWWFVPAVGEVGFELHDEQRIGYGIGSFA